jgi:hypothetical protein
MFSFDHVRPAPGLLSPACHTASLPGRRCSQVIADERVSHYSLLRGG